MDTATETVTLIETLNTEIAQLETACRDEKLALDQHYGAEIKARKDQIAKIVQDAREKHAAAERALMELAKLGKSHVAGTIARQPRRPNRPRTDADEKAVLNAVLAGKSRFTEIRVFSEVVSLDIPEDHVRACLRDLREKGLVFADGKTANMVYLPTGSAIA